MGCRMAVTLSKDGEVVSVQGNTCRRGEIYARQEVTAPVRMVTAVVPVRGSVMPLRPSQRRTFPPVWPPCGASTSARPSPQARSCRRISVAAAWMSSPPNRSDSNPHPHFEAEAEGFRACGRGRGFPDRFCTRRSHDLPVFSTFLGLSCGSSALSFPTKPPDACSMLRNEKLVLHCLERLSPSASPARLVFRVRLKS